MLWKTMILMIWRAMNDVIFVQKSHTMSKRQSIRLNACLGSNYSQRNRALRACIMNDAFNPL
jgi:hypothetical protein